MQHAPIVRSLQRPDFLAGLPQPVLDTQSLDGWAADEKRAKVCGLLCWDLLCAAVAANEPEALNAVKTASCLVDAVTGVPRPKVALFRDLAAPLAAAIMRHPLALVVVGALDGVAAATALSERRLPLWLT